MKNKSNRRPRSRRVIFYKSHGKYIGPYESEKYTKSEMKRLREDGELAWMSNYLLKSPLQIRRRVA